MEQHVVERTRAFDHVLEIEISRESKSSSDVRSTVLVHDQHAFAGCRERACEIHHTRRRARPTRAGHDRDRARPREREDLPQAFGLIARAPNQLPPPRRACRS
jgi:hypothetical protein